MIHFMLCFTRQGRVRLERWYSNEPESSATINPSAQKRAALRRELVKVILGRKHVQSCCIIEWRNLRIIYKRYASLFFCCAIDPDDNELITFEHIHRFVELLDRHFGNVCELDLIFKYDKAISIWDEIFLAGEMQESSVTEVLETMRQMELKLAMCKGAKHI